MFENSDIQNIQTKFIVVWGGGVKCGQFDRPIPSRHNNEFKTVFKMIIASLGRSV